MNKNMLVLSATTAALLALSGCGGGDDATQPTAPTTGTAYYLDSAVAGVYYRCGTQAGYTQKDGKFVFEQGKDCSFYIGNVKLKDMQATQLSDGAKIVEQDVKVAQVLQSLDVDGNATNGITITPEVADVVNAVVEDINSSTPLDDNTTLVTLLDNSTAGHDLTTLVDAIENNVTDFDGSVVDETQAQTHLTQTQTDVTKALFAAKTLYVYSEENGNNYVTEVLVNGDATSWQYTTILGGSSVGTEEIVISGDRLSIKHPEEDELDPYTVTIKDKYIELVNINDSSSLYFYYNKADAQSIFESASSAVENVTKFSTEYLNGKTLYWVVYDDFGYDGAGEPGLQWNMARMSFSNTTMTFQEYNTPDTSVHTFSYSVNDDGELIIDEEHFNRFTIVETTNDYIYVKDNDGAYSYYFFDESKAQAFQDDKNGMI